MERDAEVLPASGFVEIILRRLGFAGIFWIDDRIYILSEWINHEALRRHEQAHYQQRLRHGYVGFWMRCIWYLVRYGYRKSPFEIEARRAQHDYYA